MVSAVHSWDLNGNANLKGDIFYQAPALNVNFFDLFVEFCCLVHKF